METWAQCQKWSKTEPVEHFHYRKKKQVIYSKITLLSLTMKEASLEMRCDRQGGSSHLNDIMQIRIGMPLNPLLTSHSEDLNAQVSPQGTVSKLFIF